MRTALIVTAAALSFLTVTPEIRGEEVVTPIFVELTSPPPTVVARHRAAQSGEPFDEALHRAAVRLAQDDFLQALVTAGIPHTLTATAVESASGAVEIPDRYTELINAVRLEVAGLDVGAVRRQPGVKHISVDVPSRLMLDNSVAYIRANGPDSARSLGVRGAGQVNSDGSSSGQVIAVLDTGIDHTNPMFDITVDDAQFENRSGDARPVRLQGSPYAEGVNHPKVGYRFLFAQAPVEGDDTGHGTNSATAAGGVKARADTILNNGEIVEGVAPGAVMMDYKVCPSLVCVNQQTLLALEDSVQESDLAGFPKPVATVVNMSFGSDAGDPNAANGVAAGNLQFAGVVPEASAGNSGPQENIIGSPSAHRLVISTAATVDPGVSPNGIDVLAMDATLRNVPGSPADPNVFAVEPGTSSILSFFAPESNGAQRLGAPLAQHYVDVGFGDTPEQIPASVNGRICLAERGSTVDGGAGGSGLFSNKAAQCAAQGGIALVLYNNVPGQMGSILAPGSIPVFTISQEDGLVLRDDLGFESGDFGAVSNHPIRLNLADPSLFVPDTTGFSSRGPNNDFLVVKPDITAPGQDILMGASKIGALGSPTSFIAASGTSFSGPHVSGVAALVRDALARPDFTPSQVRAAMMNTATHLREADGTPIADDDDNVFIHETGAGLVEVVEALQVLAVMGTNELNGSGGPDDSTEPDFLPSYSFGQRAWIGTGRLASNFFQQSKVTVTIADVAGQAGSYDLSIIDAGALRGDVTRPLDENGFSLALSSDSVSVPADGAATFDVTVAVDGSASGLAIAGADVNGAEATEFLWYVVATSAQETLRMPFYLRVVRGTIDVNEAPLAVDDAAATVETQPVTIDVLANDSDPDGDALVVSAVGQPANGTATNNGDGTVTYTADAGFTGTDTFSYTIDDGRGGTASATVTVTVEEDVQQNRPPMANDDVAMVEEEDSVRIEVLANDSDPDGDPLTVTAVTQPAHGTAAINGDGSVTYTADDDFTGVDTFTYTVEDGRGGSASATVRVTVVDDDDEDSDNGDSDSDSDSDSANGHGSIADGGGQPATFRFQVAEAPFAAGHHGALRYDAPESGIALDGETAQVVISAFDAAFSGPCTLDDGSPCIFSAAIEDNAEPGNGADRFTLTVSTPSGVVIHQAGGLVLEGNVRIDY